MALLTMFKNIVAIKNAPYTEIITRNLSQKMKLKYPIGKRFPNYNIKWDGGQQYYGFTYYPRHPNQKDPAWKPTELFMIKRRKKYSGNPFWEKRILTQLGLDHSSDDVSIVINSEHNNKKLWKIKHLITITPITFPNGLPEEGDLSACRLYENGQFIVSPKVKPDSERLEATVKYMQKPETLDKHTLYKYAHYKWWHNEYQTIEDW